MAFRDPLRRKSTTATSFLDRSFPGLSLGRRQSEHIDEVRGPLGLSLLYAPSEPLIDFIFVHGLRGGSRKTWSKTENLDHFWPQQWLPLEPRFKNVRIHSFGYNSNWGQWKGSSLTVHDFGQALLGEILNSPDLSGHDENTAIVLVGHSMGGIVIKKTLLLARQDPHCQKLVGRFHSMFFLATPHRGADSAQLLRKLLSVTSNKAYVEDLVPGSMSTQLINDEFRNAYQGVQLWSFFETVSTSMGLIVDRESAVIGLPGERVQLLNADHRHVCKFDTRLDSNYCSLRNAFVASIELIEKTWLLNRRTEHLSQMQILSQYLGVIERPESELARVNQRQTEGSCKWLTDKESFQKWVGQPTSPRFFWLDGEPATGKSTTAGHVIKFIEETNGDCAFFFFKHGDSTKSSIAVLLRSLAWQMARVNSDVRQELLAMAEQGHFLDKADEGSVWRNIFAARILRLEWRRPCYWIIDALDECSNYHALFPLLSKVQRQHPLRIFLTSRPVQAIRRLFSQERFDRIAETISIRDLLEDIRLYLQANAEFLPAEDEVERNRLLTRILNRSNGNFLWTYLVLQELSDTLSVQQAYEVLESVPNGMDGLYSRILEALMSNPRNRDIAKAVLKWTVCSIRPLTIDELKEALRLDINVTLPRLESTLGSITGNLVYVDGDNKAQLAHQTVRPFLTRDHTHGLPTNDFTIIRSRDHLSIGRVCLDYLRGSELKVTRYRRGTSSSRTMKRSAFAEYAVQHFSDHIASSHSDDSTILSDIQAFLSLNSLTWIEIVATTKDLTPIVQAAKNLKAYLDRRAKYQAPSGQAIQDVTAWAADLSRLVASFGKPLMTNPGAIHFLLPPVCPSTSIIHRSFANYPRPVRVLGLSEDEWDDRISCIVNPGRQALSVTCKDIAFAVGFSDGTTHIYDTSAMQEKHVFNHRDQVRFVEFSTTDQYLATASHKKLSLWSCTAMVLTWEVKLNDPLLAMSFNEDNSLLMGATRSNSLLFWNSATGELVNSFQFFDIDESTGREYRHAGAPAHAAFSPGLNLLAVVYRQRPIVLWDLEDCSYVGQYSRYPNVYSGPLCMALIFNPKAEVQLVAAAYDDGEIVAFDPWTQRRRVSVKAHTAVMQGSRDGTVLVSGDHLGKITLYDFEALKVLYSINSYMLRIRNLAFSNDGLRFFDVRGDHCNIWEPPALVRRAEMNDESSTGPSDDASIAAPPTVNAKTYDDDRAITAMAAPHGFDVIFCGREDGSVAAYSALTGELVQELASHAKNVAVMFLHLSRSGEILVSVDRSGRIVARRLEILQGPRLRQFALVMDRKAIDVVEQILVSADDTRILVGMSHKDEVWEVETANTLGEIPRLNDGAYWRWTQTSKLLMPLVCISNGTATLYNWDLFQASHLGPSMDLCLAELGTTPVVAVTSSANASHLCILLAGSRPGLLPPILRVWNMHEMHAVSRDAHEQDTKEESTQEAISRTVLADATYDQLAKDIKFVIGVYEDSLVFLTHQGWICSLKFTSPREETHYTRHFFIPFRYHNSASSLIIHVSCKGSIVVAYRTEVVIFAGGLDFVEKISWNGDTIVPRPSMKSALGRGRSDPNS
ncbi:hypothetical protein IMSHALPRED_008796 [Imshaugia aleurites]|uniref:GPI inositol-deacylase n=1 Tax=Imshaugia aleurites TaxID=172621 RepID=A0A8H3FWP0_9LECA|nr:hypothetical protein IMSHALPRED_008796 [Imshaugia aleurites]